MLPHPSLRPLLSRVLGLAVLAVAAALPGAALAQTAASPASPASATPQRGVQVEGITEYRWPNGLQLLLVPDPGKPTTTVNLTLRVGSRHENYGETGMAHLLEHLVFKGTPTTRNAWAEFSRRGLRANGTTWLDRTNYFASFGANDETLDWYLGWLADAMVNSFIAKEDLASEMTVVRNEMEMGENNPGRILFARLAAAMYDWHNYGKSTIGARSDVETVDISRLQAFYRLHYQPDNATVIVAGRFDEAQVLRRVSQTFGALPRPTRVLPPTLTLDPAQDGERTVHLRRVGGSPILYAGYHVTPGSHPDFGAVQLLAQVLGDTPGGRLHRHLVEKNLAAGAFSWPLSAAEPGLLLLGVGLAPGQDLAPARQAMLRVLDGLEQEPVTPQELERARVQLLNNWDKGFADPEIVGIQLSEAIALGDWRLYFLARDHIRRATLDDVMRVARERLRPDNRTLASYEPTAQPQRAPAPARVDVAALVRDYRGDPTAAVAEAFDASPGELERRTQRSTLPSGMQVALLPKPTRGRLVHGSLTLRYGDVASLTGQATAQEFVAQLLTHGSAGMTRQQVADRLEALRAEVSTSASRQTLTVGFRTVREHLPATITLLGQMLRQPSLPDASVEENRKNWLQGLATMRADPEALASNALQRHGNPYPRGDVRHVPTFDEQEQNVRAVTAAQLREFHRRFYSAAQAEFAAVGDLDAAAARQALQQAFGDWRQPAAGPLPYARVPNPRLEPAPERFVIATPDKKNAVFEARLALPVNDESPDFAALQVANRIFGRGGNSRLWKRIRETEGLSYDVGTSLAWSPFEPNTVWSAWAIFAPENQPRVEAAWREELARSLRDGFTEAEVSEARAGLLNARRLQRAQDGEVAGALTRDLMLQRRFDREQRLDEQLSRVTAAQVTDAWRRTLANPRLVQAWAGDFKPSAKASP